MSEKKETLSSLKYRQKMANASWETHLGKTAPTLQRATIREDQGQFVRSPTKVRLNDSKKFE